MGGDTEGPNEVTQLGPCSSTCVPCPWGAALGPRGGLRGPRKDVTRIGCCGCGGAGGEMRRPWGARAEEV